MSQTAFRPARRDDGSILILSARALDDLALTPQMKVGALEEGFRRKASGDIVAPPMTFVRRSDQAFFSSMMSWSEAWGIAGCKFQSGDGANPARGLPFLQGLYVLADAETGGMRAVMDSAWLTANRTPAASMVAVDKLGGSTARTLAILGCGVQGLAHARLIAPHLPDLEEIRLYDRLPATAEAARDGLSDLGVPVARCATMAEAVVDAHVIVSATTLRKSRQPEIDPRILSEDCVFVSIDQCAMLTDAAIASFGVVTTNDIAQFRYKKASLDVMHAVPEPDMDMAAMTAAPEPVWPRAGRRLAVMLGSSMEDLALARLVASRL